MKILVFGKSGQLGLELQRLAQSQGDVTLDVRGRDEADFTDPEACAALVTATDAEAVINAVAYTAVDQAEREETLAHKINADTPGALARAAAARGLPFIHVSTDYVFDGKGEAPFAVDHPTAPLGAYGRSKLAGEDAVRAAGGAFAIFRTSWVVSSHGSNFVKTMLHVGADRDLLTVVDDQIGGPTPAADIAKLCVSAARQLAEDPGKSGTYQISGGPDVSWAEFARAIFEQSHFACRVEGIPSSEYPTPTERPLNSRMQNRLTQEIFDLERPDWHAGLRQILIDLGARKS